LNTHPHTHTHTHTDMHTRAQNTLSRMQIVQQERL